MMETMQAQKVYASMFWEALADGLGFGAVLMGAVISLPADEREAETTKAIDRFLQLLRQNTQKVPVSILWGLLDGLVFGAVLVGIVFTKQGDERREAAENVIFRLLDLFDIDRSLGLLRTCSNEKN